MNWHMRGNTYRSDSYVIVRTIRGFETWVKDDHRFSRLASELLTLDIAKGYCERHAQEQKQEQV